MNGSREYPMNGSLLCPMLPPLRTMPRLPPEITNFTPHNNPYLTALLAYYSHINVNQINYYSLVVF